MIKELLKLRVKKHILNAFKHAEDKHRQGNGEVKLEAAVKYISKKVLLLPCFKDLLKEVLKDEFGKHSEYINQMIIREFIRI